MTPHSQALLVFSFSLCGSLCTVSLNRNERDHFWASTDSEPATSSSWMSQSTEKDMTSPTDVLYSETNIQNDEEGPQTEASDWPNFSKQGNMEQSFKLSSLATPQPFSSQAWRSKSKKPIAWNTEIFTPQTPAETRFSTHQTLWKSSGATQTPYARGNVDGTTLPRDLTDNLQPSEETKNLTDAPTGNQINYTSEPILNLIVCECVSMHKMHAKLCNNNNKNT